MKIIKNIKVSKISHVMLIIFAVTLSIAVFFSFKLASVSDQLVRRAQNSMQAQANMISHYVAPSATSTPTLTPTPTKTKTSANSWGVAKQIDDKTWTMQVGNDEKMANANEIFTALNNYRKQNGAGQLSWDDTLANFASKRAATFVSIGGLDGHAGFNEYFKNQENMRNMGLSGVGENSSYGYKMAGVHLIEWVFAGDAPHNNNQLDKNWNIVGIAVSGTGVDLVFGKK